MEKRSSAHAEEMARRLQQKLQTERPRWYRWVPIVALVLFGLLGLFAWWIYPRPEPARLTITALDSLQPEGVEAKVRAVLEPQDEQGVAGRLEGLEVAFWMDADAAVTATSDAAGLAHAVLNLGAAQGKPFTARHLGADKKYETKDQATAFAYAKDTPLLIVEVEDTLAEIDVEHWPTTNPLSIAVRAGAPSALQAAAAKKYQLVYLALHGDHAKAYRRVRGWVEVKGAGADALPRGPVLGRPHVETGAEAKSDRSAIRLGLLETLRDQFNGPMAAVVRTAGAAEQCLKLDIRPFAMGGGDFPEGVTRLKSWADLPGSLAQKGGP